MSPGSSLSGLPEFGVNTAPDMAPTRSTESAPTGNKPSFKKSLDQAAQHQRQQTNANAPGGSRHDQPASKADAKSEPSAATAGSPSSPSSESVDEADAIENPVPAALPDGEMSDSRRVPVIDGEATSPTLPGLVKDIAMDVESDVGPGTLNATGAADSINIDSNTEAMIDVDLKVNIVEATPVALASAIPEPEVLLGAQQVQAAASKVAERLAADRLPVFAAAEPGLGVPRSLHELRFSEFLQSQAGGVPLGNMSMETLSPALATNIESMLLVDESALKLEAGAGWAIDEPSLSLASMSKAGSPLQTPGLAASEAPRISVPVNVVFGDERWQQLAAERTVTLLQQGIKSAELMLDPPELGPLQVRIQMQNDQAVIHFTSANAAVRDALDQSFPRLREMLQEQGVELMQADVSDQSSQHSDGEEDSEDRGPFYGRGTETLPESVLDPATQRHSLVLNAGIDDFA